MSDLQSPCKRPSTSSQQQSIVTAAGLVESSSSSPTTKKPKAAMMTGPLEVPATASKASKTSVGSAKKDYPSNAAAAAAAVDYSPIIAKVVAPNNQRRRLAWSSHQDKTCLCGSANDDAPRTRVAAFDLDGTLVVTPPSVVYASALAHYELWNPNVIRKLRQLYDTDDMKLLVVSNQGGIQSAHNKIIATRVKTLVEWLAHTIDRPIHFICSTTTKSGLHKPAPTMWKLAEQYCNNNVAFDVSKSFFVGDSVAVPNEPKSGVGTGFASAVGLLFYTPDDFFGKSSLALRSALSMVVDETIPKEVLATRAAFASGYLNDKCPILLLLCGVQGAGKSFFCRKLLGADDTSTTLSQPPSRQWVYLSQDTIKDGKPGARGAVEAAAAVALRNGKSVSIDRTHLSEGQRQYFLNVAASANVPVHAVVLNPPKDVIAARIRSRTDHPAGFQGESFVQIALNGVAQLALPKYAEGFGLIHATATAHGAARIAEQYRNLGSGDKIIPLSFSLDADVSLPSIALGTMNIGRTKAFDVVSRAISMGFEAVDTAPTYKNEPEVGMALAKTPDTFCIAKVPKRANTAPKVRDELTKSLGALQRPRADLLLLHWPSDTETMKQVWQEMEACRTDGLAKALGVCNFGVHALTELLSFCKMPPLVNQVERHVLLPQWDLVEFCSKHDILLQAHTPLGQGSKDVLGHPVVTKVAAVANISPAAVLLKWNLQQSVAVVPKCTSDAHMEDVLSACNSPLLSVDYMKELNAIRDTKRFIPA